MSFLPKNIETRLDKIIIKKKLNQDDIFSILKKLTKAGEIAMENVLGELET